jgi:hypothetical protein
MGGMVLEFAPAHHYHPLNLSQNLKPLVILKTIVACSEQSIVIRLAEKDGDMALKAMRFLNLLLAGCSPAENLRGSPGYTWPGTSA